MQVPKYVIMQPCEYATIRVCDTPLLPHSCPIREFQLSWKSCNLSSWTTKWHDFVPRMGYESCLELLGQWLKGVKKVSKRHVKDIRKVWNMLGRCYLKVSGKFLIVSRMLPYSGPTWNFNLSSNLARYCHKSWAMKWIDYWGKIHPTTLPNL